MIGVEKKGQFELRRMFHELWITLGDPSTLRRTIYLLRHKATGFYVAKDPSDCALYSAQSSFATLIYRYKYPLVRFSAYCESRISVNKHNYSKFLSFIETHINLPKRPSRIDSKASCLHLQVGCIAWFGLLSQSFFVVALNILILEIFQSLMNL